MSYTLTLEPEVRSGAEAYAVKRGMTLDDVINSYLVLIAKLGRECNASRSKPKVSDYIGYGLKFDPEPKTTAEYMSEMREGESA